jgi:hypothetical protein
VDTAAAPVLVVESSVWVVPPLAAGGRAALECDGFGHHRRADHAVRRSQQVPAIVGTKARWPDRRSCCERRAVDPGVT